MKLKGTFIILGLALGVAGYVHANQTAAEKAKNTYKEGEVEAKKTGRKAKREGRKAMGENSAADTARDKMHDAKDEMHQEGQELKDKID